MSNILKRGINSNMLKTIAIIAMVIDHIGFYFLTVLPNGIYIVCRYIGRISMPIFVYLLVQGFFYTKNYKKYLSRISLFAVITQVLITILALINIKWVSDYIYATQVYCQLNILFTFAILLIMLKLLHEPVIVKKWSINKNLTLKIILVFVGFVICAIIPLDYNIEVPILGVLFYYIEKLKITVLMAKSKTGFNFKKMFLFSIDEYKIKSIYLMLIGGAIFTLIIYFNARWTIMFALLFIAMYNGERGKINLKYLYYIVFPLQHILLYSLAMIVTLT